MGGQPSSLLDFRSPVVCLSLVEICQYVFIILGFTLIRIGDALWKAPGVTIGNPFGRIALGAVTGRDETMRDFWWNLAFMCESKFDALSKQGLKREQVFSMYKYVD